MPIAGDRYPFTQDYVNRAPAQHGVYQLEEGNVITYIGRASGDGVTIRSRLQSHYRGDEGPCTKAAKHYRREVTNRPIAREKELLDEFHRQHGRFPRCNDRAA